MRSTSADVMRLAGEISGDVVTPDHGEYETARRVWNGMIDRRPAAIARCACADDVATAIAFAAAERLPVAVRGALTTSPATRHAMTAWSSTSPG